MDLAALCVATKALPSKASLYYTESATQTRILVVDPFSSRAMQTLGQINGVGNQFGSEATPVLSIDNVIERVTFEDPTYGTSFRVNRTLTFDLDLLLRKVDTALDPYRKNGCSKFKISYPRLLTVRPHSLRLRIDMSFKKRACANYLGTTDLASGHGHAIIVANLRSFNKSPELTFEAETIDIDTDTVLGINPNSMIGSVVRFITVNLAKVLGSLNPVRGTIGELQFKLALPLTKLAKAETISAAEVRYSSTQIANIVRGYGRLSDMLRNADAWKLEFTLPESGMTRRPEYRLRPEFAGKKDPKLCSEIGPGGLQNYYCVPTGEKQLVLKIVQTWIFAEDGRDVVEGHFRREAIYLSSLSSNTALKFYRADVQTTRIVDENYIDQLFRPFFQKHNPKPECTREISPGRAVSTGELLCGYMIVPAWQKILAVPN